MDCFQLSRNRCAASKFSTQALLRESWNLTPRGSGYLVLIKRGGEETDGYLVVTG
jgi:hypothetical protein